ncbi:hypothetical protein P7K49_021282, partial [Saguinus oedipus]
GLRALLHSPQAPKLPKCSPCQQMAHLNLSCPVEHRDFPQCCQVAQVAILLQNCAALKDGARSSSFPSV